MQVGLTAAIVAASVLTGCSGRRGNATDERDAALAGAVELFTVRLVASHVRALLTSSPRP